VTPADRWLLSLPLWHVGGLGILFRTILAGASIVIPAVGESIQHVIQRAGVTHISMVATQLERLLRENKDRAPETLKTVLLGGSDIPPLLIDEALDRGYPLYTTYGMTEMSSQVTTTPPGASRRQLHTSGRLLSYRSLCIADDGEILLKGAVLFKGYLENTKLRAATDCDGWFHSGDKGILHDDGFLLVTGRMDNMFISGGENIQPEEIERVVYTLPGIEKVVVVPVFDTMYGQRPVAFVQATKIRYSNKQLVRSLEAVLPRFKIPVAFFPWPQDISLQGGKYSRKLFCDRAAALI